MKFPKLVIEEAKALKKHATKEERAKLDYENLDAEHYSKCIYGQMTGDCYSVRAHQLIGVACKRVYVKDINKPSFKVGENTKVNGKPKFTGDYLGRAGHVWLSPIEVFISKAEANGEHALLERLVKFIKGEIKSL